jgi:hypothetical protein
MVWGNAMMWAHQARIVPMPTLRKRINVTPSDEVWVLINEVNALTGTPKASIISEMLDAIAPVFQNTIQALRVVNDQPREAQRLIQNFANESIGRVAQQQLELDAAIDARTVKGARAKRRAGGRATP